jgi:hypothetical protein
LLAAEFRHDHDVSDARPPLHFPEASMKILRLVVTGTAVLIAAACGHDVLGPDPAPAPAVQGNSPELAASAARRVETSGSFEAIVDFSTITFTPKGSNCLLTVKGKLVFTGTIVGEAPGQTNALVFATCADVASHPPGTYPDVFVSTLAFTGTVDGSPAEANVIYTGRSEPGGHISAHLIFYNGVAGVLDVDAQLAVGGTYDGSVVVH